MLTCRETQISCPLLSLRQVIRLSQAARRQAWDGNQFWYGISAIGCWSIFSFKTCIFYLVIGVEVVLCEGGGVGLGGSSFACQARLCKVKIGRVLRNFPKEGLHLLMLIISNFLVGVISIPTTVQSLVMTDLKLITFFFSICFLTSLYF